MQSNNSFTVGGSISANCHGWQPNRPPIASTVERFRLMKADGEIVHCSRHEHEELFALVLGGYGLFGVILDAELRVVMNQRYQMTRTVLNHDDFAEAFDRQVNGHSDVGMAYGRLCVAREQFLEQMLFNVFVEAPAEPGHVPTLGEGSLTSLKRAVFRGSADSDYGKALRWEAELMLSDRLSQSFVWRNQLLNDPVELYQNRDANHADILHEYFVPTTRFGEFVRMMRDILPQHSCDLLNVTVRHVISDQDTMLRYADQDMFALVLLFNQERSADADAKMQALTRELIDAALALGGRYYLPYRLHATQEQFERAYPMASDFFQLKRNYDPQEVFQNGFYTMYAK
jgi:FAD/FMN-containing dehydrogenase